MGNDVQIPIRLPAEVVERAETLVPKMERDPKRLGWRVSRSSVLREALIRGLDLLEAEYGMKKQR